MTSVPQQRLMPWKIRAVRALSADDAIRVFTPEELGAFLSARLDMAIPRRTLHRALGEWEAMGLVSKVLRGVYLNLKTTPQPTLDEVAQKIRPGAIVSLMSVLGRCGALNNPTPWVTAVIPSDAASRSYNDLETEAGSRFKFAFMVPALVPTPEDPWNGDALEPHAKVPTATPEKALLDWIYLATSGRGGSRWRLPASHDLDLDYLDHDRLARLAQRMGLGEQLEQFTTSAQAGPRVSVKRALR